MKRKFSGGIKLAFFKENSYHIFKMFITQIGMTVFGTVLAFATGRNASFLLLTSVFSALFYLSLLYSMMWEIGAKDKIRVEGHRMEKKPLHGLSLSIYANIPNILLVLLLIVGYIFGSKAIGIEQEWAGSIYLISNTVLRLLLGMYTGTINYFLPKYETIIDSVIYRGIDLSSFLNPVFFLAAILPSLIVCAAGYYFGTKELRFSSIFKLKTTK